MTAYGSKTPSIKVISPGLEAVSWVVNATGDGSGGAVQMLCGGLPNARNILITACRFYTADANAQKVELDTYAMENTAFSQSPLSGAAALEDWGSYKCYVKIFNPPFFVGKKNEGTYPFVGFFSTNTNGVVYYMVVHSWLADDNVFAKLTEKGIL